MKTAFAHRRKHRAGTRLLLGSATTTKTHGEDAMPIRWTIAIVAAVAVNIAAIAHVASQPKPTLDYGFYKSHVEPIFLTKREGHTRCVVCHAESNNALHLEKRPGPSGWSDEQSRRNFETVSKLVNPGDPDTSRLVMQPLAPEAGGNVYHSGGRQFE